MISLQESRFMIAAVIQMKGIKKIKMLQNILPIARSRDALKTVYEVLEFVDSFVSIEKDPIRKSPAIRYWFNTIAPGNVAPRSK